jgi:integrase
MYLAREAPGPRHVLRPNSCWSSACRPRSTRTRAGRSSTRRRDDRSGGRSGTPASTGNGGRPRRKAAEKALRRLLNGLDEGTAVAPAKVTLGAFLADWLRDMKPHLAPNTWETYGHFARAYILPRVGEVPLQQLTAGRLRSFYTDLAENGGRRGQGLAPKTVKHVHVLIHRALEDAVEQGLVSRNVAGLRSARPPAVPKVERRVWAPETLRSFLEAMREDRL